MKKGAIIALSILGVLLIVSYSLYSWGKNTYNDMVTKDEAIKTQWANVQNQYQRRLNLIPNLVATVKGYADHEEGTLTAVVEARSKATQTVIDVKDINNLDDASMKKFQQAQSELSSALSRLLAVREAYPDLKANQNFLELQAQLEGTENRIAVERGRFNEICKEYNTTIRRFPANILAGMFNFDSKPYFEADQAAQSAPKVEF